MRTVIAGGHGKIAQRLERLLAARGDRPAGLIRKPEQAEALLAAGAEPLVCDLESASVAELTRHLEGADEEPPAGTDPVFAAYLRAKAAADADLRARTSLDWTILRPGRLTDAPGTGLV
ncbi:NAD(P)H-binding protein, partial [Streptomyces harbinensis]|uniref:NAD(P)H-binding protein n=1 Tax=Streptomyces harbinensis TaxID=1176198 RepID=UPI0034DEB882